MDRKTKTATGIKVGVLTRADVRAAIQLGRLSEEEERYVRMRFGISEPHEAEVARRRTEVAQTRAQVALIEADALARHVPPSGNPLKDRIVEKLRRL